MSVVLGKCERFATDGDRITTRLRRMDRATDLLAEDGELVDGCWPVHIGRHQVGTALHLGLEIPGKFAYGGGLSRALQADQHNRHRGGSAEVESCRLPAHEGGELGVDDLDELLRWREAG